MHDIWCWITANAQAITAIAAAIGALFTALYLIATLLIFNEARKSTDAAEKPATAAKEPSDLTAALHRPYMGLVDTKFSRYDIGQICQQWQITWTFKNFGTIPASHVGISSQCWLEFTQDGRRVDLQIDDQPPGDAEIFPESDPITRTSTLSLERDLGERVETQTALLFALATAQYATPSGTKYKQTTRLCLDHSRNVLRPIESRTEPL